MFSKEQLAGLADKSQNAYAALFSDGSIDQPQTQEVMDSLEPETLRLIAINVVRTCPKEQLSSLIPQTQHLLRTPASSFTQKLQDAHHVHNRISIIMEKPQLAHKAWKQNFKPEAFHGNADFAHELLGNDADQKEKAHSLAENTPACDLVAVMQNVKTAFPDTPSQDDFKFKKHCFTQHVKRALQAAVHIDSLATCKDDSELVQHLAKLTKHFADYPNISKRLTITSHLEEVAKRIANMDHANRTAACNHLNTLCPKAGSNIFVHIQDWVKDNIPAEQTHASSQLSAAPDSPKSVNPGRVKCGIFGGCSTSKAEDNGAYYSDSDTEEEKKGSCWSWGSSH
ncbi:hypothetical protein [Legionella quinlivanii]|uniref:hypothetical protein n=1 Tax=Legionella quinlivanii TaxID=45073 RepID=UPI002243A7A5|nr:hypothetical protein [Legionella quinlivanii]MCW8452239.1 hypothetical protein [Legionella quinlivanii]